MPSDSKKGVLFLIPKLHIGGTERKFISLAKILAREGYQTAIAYFAEDERLRVFSEENVTFFSSGPNKWKIRALRNYRGFVFSGGFRCVFLMGFFTAALHKAVTTAMMDRPKEYLCLNTSIPKREDRSRLPFYKMFLRKMMVVFGAERQRIAWRDEFGFSPSQWEVVYNGVDRYHFSPVTSEKAEAIRTSMGIDRTETVIGVVAALRPEKAIGDVIEATSRLRKMGLRVKMIIAGDGPERQCLEQVALKHEVSEKVVFLGSVLDVRPALSAMDLFVLPSRAVETFSNAALEAMSMGLPVVLSDIGGAREMVPDGKNGAIFAPGDVDGLTEKIEKLIRSGVLDEMGAASRSLVEERFSLESMVARYRDLIQRC